MQSQRQRCVVKYQIASYSGEEIVYCNSDDDYDYIIAKCKRQLSRDAPLPFGSQSFRIVERKDYYGN
jgi:hypothetical protein